MKHELSEKWIKAAIAGTIWAASEIVLGSFLHNLRIPFSGNILTAIGIIILISISHTWSDRGIFWRAGVICAIMKTMSPSAVIFGPMIAIIAEAFLLELSVRILGRTYAGYIIGAMMAMSWNLFHKIASYIISYGSKIVEVYTRLLNMAQKQLNLETDIVWLPIIILLVIYALFGFFTAVIGIMVGRKMLNRPKEAPQRINDLKAKASDIHKSEFDYSLFWLLADILLIIGSFILLTRTTWIIWSPTVAAVILVWSFRYKNSLRRISKPKFWVIFVFITLITAFVFSKTETGETDILNGLLTGIQMNFRAALIIVGFSVLGTELYNPRIRDFFSGTSFKHLPLALELSVESLPEFIAGIPDFKTLVRNPVSVFSNVISHAEVRLSEIMKKTKLNRKVFIVSGSIIEGKTIFTKKVAGELKRHNISLGGILSERVMGRSETTGYDLTDIETGEKMIFLRENEDKWTESIGKFKINPEGLQFGISILSAERMKRKKLVIIDEVGRLEMENKGWANCLQELLNSSESHILITVRDSHVDEVINKWSIADPVVFRVSETDFLTAGKIIIDMINT